MILSIIIPIYNTSKYLNKCLDSVINQGFDDYEIILVDDGSTDNSRNICDDYSSRYNFIKTIHTQNFGLSAARNQGLSLAKGEFVYIMDSDDELLPGIFSTMINNAIRNQSDVVCCSYTQIDEFGNISENNATNKEYILNKEDALKHFLMRDKIYSQVWTKIYKRTILEQNKIVFKVGFQTDEDILFNLQVLTNSSTITIVDQPFYLYKQRGTSLTGEYYKKNIRSFLNNMVYRLQFTEEIISKNTPYIINTCKLHCLKYYNFMMGRAAMFNYKECQPYFATAIYYTRKHPLLLLRNASFCGYSKSGILLLFMLPSKLYFMYRKRKNIKN